MLEDMGRRRAFSMAIGLAREHMLAARRQELGESLLAGGLLRHCAGELAVATAFLMRHSSPRNAAALMDIGSRQFARAAADAQMSGALSELGRDLDIA